MIEINNLTKDRISQPKIKSFLKKLFKILRIKKDLSLAFVSVPKIKKLNQTYLKKNRVTDVLSFKGEKKLLGETVICLSQAKKQAKLEKHSLEKEIKILITHGILHLLGFNHQTKKEREKMRRKEARLFRMLKI